MKRIAVFLFALQYIIISMFLLTGNAVAVRAEGTSSSTQASAGRENELIIKYKAETGKRASTATVKSVDRRGRIEKVKVSGYSSSGAAVEELKKQKDIESVQPNYSYRKVEASAGYKASGTPNDPYLSSQWYIPNLNLSAAWDVTQGDGVVVAVVDTGIDQNHEELLGKVIGSMDFTGTGSAMDDEGHGTHVAGIIAASSNNARGIAGIAPNVKLLNVKVLDANGEGYTYDIYQGIEWAADNGAKIINLSLGGEEDDPMLKQAVDYAASKGCIVIAASGNEGVGRVCYPAAYDSVISVGATNEGNQLAEFSNFGRKVDMVAPGVNILSSVPSRLHNMYEYMSGTSMSTAFASGELALIVGRNPAYTLTDIKKVISENSFDLGKAGFDEAYGNGLLNIDKALGITGMSLLPAADPAGDDNTYLQAVNVTQTSQITGSLKYYCDVNWYKIAVQPGKTLDVNLAGTIPAGLQLDIYGSDLAVPAATLTGSAAGPYHVPAAQNTASQYYVKIYNSTGAPADYSISAAINEAPVPTVKYQSHVESIGWQSWYQDGQVSGVEAGGKRLEAIKIVLDNPIQGMKIKYKTHVQNIGWQDWVYDGALSGTQGRSLRTEAIRIALEGVTGYSVQYQAYVENLGWQPWVRDGMLAGTEGKGLKLEAIRVKIVKLADTSPTIIYQTHVENVGWQDWIANGMLAGTEGRSLRLEALRIKLLNPLPGMKIKYQVHVQNVGWQDWKYDEELSGTEGRSLRLEAIRIVLEGAPGYSIEYQTHVQNVGWQDWVRDGAMAGTQGRGLRMEAMRIRLVKTGN